MNTDPHGAVEVLDGRADTRVVLTCEHASQRLPEPWAWPPADAHLVGTHWAFDPGAADITRGLHAAMAAPAVLSRFSRLLIDPNREPTSDTLFRQHADGHPVDLNVDLTDAEREARMQGLWAPYHAAIDRVVEAHPQALVLSMHSFTPLYEGERRPMEVGVLFDLEEQLAHVVADRLARHGLRVALNAPYSGRGGLMYSAHRHAEAHGRRALELELRQDLATDPAWAPRLCRAIHEAVDAGIAEVGTFR